jgi:hypothetical protein
MVFPTSMLSEMFAVVRCKGDEGVLMNPEPFEFLQEA